MVAVINPRIPALRPVLPVLATEMRCAVHLRFGAGFVGIGNLPFQLRLDALNFSELAPNDPIVYTEVYMAAKPEKLQFIVRANLHASFLNFPSLLC